MPLSKLRSFLDSHNVKYLVISHSLAYTAQGVAALAHVSGKRLAKTVIVELATEREFKDAFSDCETGAMPPFGNLYGMTVYADANLASNEEITFTAGSHRELVRMDWEDLVRLVKPTVDDLTYQPASRAAA